MEDVWTLSRERGKDTLILEEKPLRWLVVDRIAGWLIGPRWSDWAGQRLVEASDKRTTEVARLPLTPEQLREIDPDWADIWETLEVDPGEEITT